MVLSEFIRGLKQFSADNKVVVGEYVSQEIEHIQAWVPIPRDIVKVDTNLFDNKIALMIAKSDEVLDGFTAEGLLNVLSVFDDNLEVVFGEYVNSDNNTLSVIPTKIVMLEDKFFDGSATIIIDNVTENSLNNLTDTELEMLKFSLRHLHKDYQTELGEERITILEDLMSKVGC